MQQQKNVTNKRRRFYSANLWHRQNVIQDLQNQLSFLYVLALIETHSAINLKVTNNFLYIFQCVGYGQIET